MAQRNNPSKLDWIQLVQGDMKKYSINHKEEQIISLSEEDFKKQIRKYIKQYSFRELTNIKLSHKKVKVIKHSPLSGPQAYLISSKLTRKMCSLLYNLKCKSVKGIKDNVHRQFKEDLSCPFQCHV